MICRYFFIMMMIKLVSLTNKNIIGLFFRKGKHNKFNFGISIVFHDCINKKNLILS